MADGAKQLVPIMQRADEVQKTHPRVAYYCARPRVPEAWPRPAGLKGARSAAAPDAPRAPAAGRMYALEAGMALPNRTADTNTLLGVLLRQLEARRVALPLRTTRRRACTPCAVARPCAPACAARALARQLPPPSRAAVLASRAAAVPAAGGQAQGGAWRR